jgi:hypothetical protein
MPHTPTPQPAVCHLPDGTVYHAAPPPRAVLPGSFNPLHHGHTTLAQAAAAKLGVEVHFELSVTNAEKPELPLEEVTRRLKAFHGVAPVWITRAWAFEAKADLFPGTAFVLGYDTAIRLIDPRFYGVDEARRDAALRKLLDRGCRVVVGGRIDAGGVFRTWASEMESKFGELFVPLTEADFRIDLSSTQLRANR